MPNIFYNYSYNPAIIAEYHIDQTVLLKLFYDTMI
jgi:hypothetical protein